VRVWDTENLVQKSVLKTTLARPGRVAVTACAYNADGSVIAGGLMDGSIQLWDVRGAMSGPASTRVGGSPAIRGRWGPGRWPMLPNNENQRDTVRPIWHAEHVIGILFDAQ
jgi:WD40 repeat protein